MTKFSKIVALAFVGLTLAAFAWFVTTAVRGKNKLPVLGEPGHVTGNFSFTDQHGKIFTQDDISNKIVVIEYFFTTCPGICKIMNRNLSKVHERFKADRDFVILSHTVDPERDSVPVLAAYAARMNVKGPGWVFLTGDKTALYAAAKNDYLLAVQNNPGTSIEDEFIHTEHVALLDRSRRIRGFYDATDSLSMVKLEGDVRRLMRE